MRGLLIWKTWIPVLIQETLTADHPVLEVRSAKSAVLRVLKVLPQCVSVADDWGRIFRTSELPKIMLLLVEIISNLRKILSNLIFPKRDRFFRVCKWGGEIRGINVFMRNLRSYFSVLFFHFSDLQFPPSRIARKLWGVGARNSSNALFVSARAVGV